MTRLGWPHLDRRTAFLVVGLLAAVVYLNSLPNGFVYDDQLIVQTNTSIHSLDSLPGALMAPYWPGENGLELGLWRPVTTGIFALEWAVGDGSPAPFHAMNIVAHVVVSLLVLALLIELMSLPAAFAGALVFAVHPVHVEAVANIVGFSELISTAAVVAACLVHVRSGPKSGWGSALTVGVLYLFGFGAKEGAVTLPGLIFLVDAVRGDVGFRDLVRYLGARWRVYAVMLAVAIGLLFARFSILGSIANPLGPLGGDLLEDLPRIWTLGEIWLHYVRLWVFPLDLSADYSPGVIPVSVGWHAANSVGAALALLVLGLALWMWKRPAMSAGLDTARAAAFGVVWFVISISPVSNTLFLSGVLLAERTLYLPSVGLAAATGWLVVRLSRDRPRGAWVALAVVVVASSVRTVTRNPMWLDNPTMLNRLIEDYPHSGRSQWVLADALTLQGRTSEGLRSYRAAVNLLGTHYQLIAEVVARLIQTGEFGPAETLARFAAEDRPEFARAWAQLALIRAELADPVGTEQYARTALRINPSDPARQHLLAWALAAQGRIPEAENAHARALQLGGAAFWQAYMYKAYVYRASGDSVAAYAVIDSAWAVVGSNSARAALDLVRVAEFGLDLLGTPP